MTFGYRLKRQWSIRTYMILMNLILLAVLFPTVTLLFWEKSTEQHQAQLNQILGNLRTSLEDRGASLSRSIALGAEQALAGFDFTFLGSILAQVVEADKDIDYCQVVDNAGTVISHSDPALVGTRADQGLGVRALAVIRRFPHRQDANGVTPVVFLDAQEDNLIEVVTPLYLGADLWGGLRCGISLQQLHAGIERAQKERDSQIQSFGIYFFSIGLVFLAFGVITALFFTRLLLGSLERLSNGVRRVSSGDLVHKIEDRDLFYVEFALLAQSFNRMTANLLESRRKLDGYNRSLEEKVARRTEALKAAQSQLVQHARESGMAEIAQGVMHNIGNALTPLKTAAQVTHRQFRESSLRHHLGQSLSIAAKIIDQSAHPDRDRLLRILALIPESIEEEYARAEEQLLRINERIEHIEGIIQLQARYTRITDSSEVLDFNHIILDALEMMEDSLQKYQVRVHTRLGELPGIQGEKHQLLQVLLNLIKNANEAMFEAPPDRRHLTVETHLASGRIRAVFTDTGCGFDAGVKQRIFSFGYTTKEQGTGVGLHASANYIISLGGTLEAESPGPDQGAVFTLTLPLSQRA